MLQWEPFAGGHIGPGGRSVRQRRAGRDGARPYRRGERADGGEVRYRECTAAGRCGHRPLRETRVAAGCGHPALRVHHRWCAASGPMYLRHGFRRPNFVSKFGASVRSSCPTEEFSPGVCTLWKTSSEKGADRLLTGREKDAILKAYRRGWVWQPGAAGGNARRYAPLAAKECGCVQIQVEPRIVSIRPELFGSGRFSMPRRGKEGRCGDFSGSGRAFWRSPSA